MRSRPHQTRGRRAAAARPRATSRAVVLLLGVVLPFGAEAAAVEVDEVTAALAMPASTDEAAAPDDGAENPSFLFQPPARRAVAPADLPPASVFARGRPRLGPAPAQPGGPWPAGRGAYRDIVDREAARFGVPADLVEAVMTVESSNNPATIGADGEIGLMQVMPATARMLGFAGTDAELAVPETNLYFGVRYLAGAWRLAGQDICTATMKYRAGHGETRFSYRSVSYCVRVRAILQARGFPVTGTVPEPTFGDPPGVASFAARGRGPAVSRAERVNIEALNTRLRDVVDRVVVRAVR